MAAISNKFIKGLLKGLAYYGLAALATWLTLKLFGYSYIHGPGLHHIVAFLFLAGGIGYLLYALGAIIFGSVARVNFGVFVIHILAVISVAAYIALDGAEDTAAPPDPADMITVTKDTITGGGVIVDGNGDTLFYQKGDSSIINKITKDPAIDK